MYHGINSLDFWHVLCCITLPLVFANYANVLIFSPFCWSSHLTQFSLYSPFSASNFLTNSMIYWWDFSHLLLPTGLLCSITWPSLPCVLVIYFVLLLHEENWFIKFSKNYCEIFAYNYQLFHNNSMQLIVLPLPITPHWVRFSICSFHISSKFSKIKLSILFLIIL